MPTITPEEAGGKNVCALLDAIAWSEIGPGLLAHSDNGYDVLVGSTDHAPLLFDSYATHPDVYSPRLRSTAAGRYQLLYRYWVAYSRMLGLPDFSPLSQDRIALQQIREQGALGHIHVGDLAAAIAAVNDIWASLPGSPYGQHEQDMASLQGAYVAAGGTLA
jgi:muramidase (phage lysozyme)